MTFPFPGVVGAVVLAAGEALGQGRPPEMPDPNGPYLWFSGWMWYLVGLALVVAVIAWLAGRGRRVRATGSGEEPWDRPGPRM